MQIAIQLDAGHDANGNPRRCYVVLDAVTQAVVDIIGEQYDGDAGLRAKYPGAKVVMSVPTTVRYYRQALKGKYFLLLRRVQ